MKVLQEFTPDTVNYPNVGAMDVMNMFVKAVEQEPDGLAHTYAPFGTPSYISTATLAKRCQGFITCKDTNGNTYNFAGDANDLYSLNSATFSNVSKTTGVYSTGADYAWNFAQYGSRIIATNNADEVQTFVIGTDSKFSDLSTGNAPKARYVATVKDFVVLGGLSTYPNGIQWSGLDQPSLWAAPGSNTAIQNQSDIQIMPEGGWVQGITGGVAGIDGLVFTDTMLYRMQYEGYPTVFGFYPVDRGKGTPAPGSIINQGQFVAYLAVDGFYMFDGTGVKPIGAGKVDKFFWGDCNQSYMHRITATVDPINKLIIWSYPSTASGNGSPDSLLIYNWYYQKWSRAMFPHELLSRSTSPGYTLESLGSIGTLETLPFSLDSRVWLGGAAQLCCFDPVNHSLGYITANTNDCYVITDAEIADGGMITQMSIVKPVTDATTYQVSIGTQAKISDAIVWSTPSVVNNLGQCCMRVSGRYVYIKIIIPAGTTWKSLWGYEVHASLKGTR